METVLINYKNGTVKMFENVQTTMISGNHLIIITKQSEINTVDHINKQAYLLTSNDVFNLDEIKNYTIKIETKHYD